MGMNRHGIARIVAVLVGAAVLFGLELGFGVQFYYAIPAGVLVYIVKKFGNFARVFGRQGGII